VPDGAISCDLSDYPGFASFDLPVYEEPAEVPTLGSGWYGTPAVDVVNAQGDHVTDLRFAGYRMMPGKQPLKGLPATYVEKEEEAASLEIFLRDPLTDLEAAVLYTIYNDSGALTRSIRLRNSGTEPLTLRGVMSASVPLWGMDYEAVYLKGDGVFSADIFLDFGGAVEHIVVLVLAAAVHHSIKVFGAEIAQRGLCGLYAHGGNGVLGTGTVHLLYTELFTDNGLGYAGFFADIMAVADCRGDVGAHASDAYMCSHTQSSAFP